MLIFVINFYFSAHKSRFGIQISHGSPGHRAIKWKWFSINKGRFNGIFLFELNLVELDSSDSGLVQTSIEARYRVLCQTNTRCITIVLSAKY